ncbi:Thioredoxin reductase [Bosea sp. CRIB-10]|uniref:NAD(P)/FAD-dependent oxidoreductase n=1 Tax=Bosea sp. CRIB-10 TaxID=378404 RepID=UPI0008EAC510|nr:NAD(P)/FAD-dependent oxidoreductase [Bosea sp. CRIB-10]SFC77181.1 Thioredoxin reductase [Bosea sp. CRIB-10]
MPSTTKPYDAIIVGGSFAGLSAGLQLARARRSILVIDEGQRRNRFSSHSHGFLGQDGREPAAIVAEAKAQLLAYPTVAWHDARAAEARAEEDGFSVVDANGEEHQAKRLLLATGVRDELPAIPGLKERWGKSVLHCPYCDGYELGGGKLGVLASGSFSALKAALVADWGAVTLFLNGEAEPDAEATALLERRGVTVERTAIVAAEGQGTAMTGLRLVDGRLAQVKALFVAAGICPASPLAEELGCAFDDGPFGPLLRVDGMKQTSVSGVYAAGDAATARHSVALAVADGVVAGTGLHMSLL